MARLSLNSSIANKLMFMMLYIEPSFIQASEVETELYFSVPYTISKKYSVHIHIYTNMNEITEGVITSSPSTEKTLINYDFILEFQAEELMLKSEVDALVSTSLQLLNESCESVTDVMKVHDVQVNDQSLSINRDFLILDITMHTSTDANRIINEKSDREAISNCFESNYRRITDSISTQRAILVGDTFQVQQTQREFPVLIVSLIAGGCAVALMLIFLMDRSLRKRYEDDLDNASDVENAEIRRSEKKDEFNTNPIQHQMMQVGNKTPTNIIPNNPNQQYRSPVQYVRPSSRLNLDLEEMSSDESLLSLAKDCAETPPESCVNDGHLFQNASFGQKDYEEVVEQHNSSNASATYRNERVSFEFGDLYCIAFHDISSLYILYFIDKTEIQR